ncbi:FUSC family protein [Arenibaculum pallidiluteum]|uniref:FUSC family protein n=1 Tax=Arenibaculum pallidiluteum TaxID=2812559 RepID=UPI001A9760CE|nr:FUSC family protein [Arenibaculum pallidiluteum]
MDLFRDTLLQAWNRFAASDPGLVRLRFAARVVLAVILSLGMLLPLRGVIALPTAALALAFVLSFLSAVAVRDPLPAQQRTTMLLMVPLALASVTLAAVLSPWPPVARAAFLGVVFAATYVRRYGLRWAAVGTVSFNAHFLGNFLQPAAGDWPFLALGISVGVGNAMLLRFVIMPDRPKVMLRRVLRAIGYRIAAILDAAAEAVTTGEWTERRRRRLRHHVAALNEAMLMAEGHIGALHDRAGDQEQRADTLRWALLSAELAAERVAASAPSIAPAPAVRQKLVKRLRILAAAAAGSRPPADAPSAGTRLALALDEMAAALGTVASFADGNLGATPERPATPPDKGPAPPAAAGAGLLETTRQAIQVTVACALAMAGGLLVSGDRWEWAVLTTFVVFAGTRSRGDILEKGVQRVAGTLAGVGAGLAAAILAAGHPVLELILALGSLFLGFYFFQLSHGIMVFWITVMIALLYGVLGMFTPAALVIRLDETAVGALAGGGVGLLLFPTRMRDLLRSSGRTLLGALNRLVAASIARLRGDAGRRDTVDAARALDRSLQDLRTSAQPAIRRPFLLPPGRVARAIEVMSACGHWARELVLACNIPGPPPAEPVMAPIGAAGTRVCASLDELCTALAERRAPALRSAQSLTDRAESAIARAELPQDQRRRLCRIVHALGHLDRTLLRLGTLVPGG